MFAVLANVNSNLIFEVTIAKDFQKKHLLHDASTVSDEILPVQISAVENNDTA